MTALRKHGLWLVLTMLAGVVAVWLFVRAEPVHYASTAQVDVESHVVPGATLVTPNQATEKIVATSGVVVVNAARALGVNPGLLAPHLSAGVSSTSNILSISCSMPAAAAAQRCAAAAAAAYIAFRDLSASPKAVRAADPLQATLVTAADLPLKPAGTSKKILYALGAVLGLLLGLGEIFVRDALDGRVRDRDDLSQCLGAPAVAAVPRMFRYTTNPAFVFCTAPSSRPAEAYRYLRARLGPMLTPAGHPATVLLVAGAQPREGRTSVAVNLATALTQAGARVLLVDADLRHPALGQVFGAGPAPGLTDLLAEQATLDQAAMPTSVPGLSLVTAGAAAAGDAELFEVTQLAKVFADMRGAADAIVVDSAPVLAVSDAITLARVADVVIMVADLRRTRRASVRAAAAEIKTISPATLLGLVNRAPRPLSLGRARPPATDHPAARTPPRPPAPHRHNGLKPGHPDLAPPVRPTTHTPAHRARNDTPASATAAAGDSLTVAAWTIVSRVTGLIRFACIGAVLGPTFFGNTYQLTNSLPNLIYYGFLAGSLFSSLLVPALVRHIDAGDRRASERVAGGFLGMTLVSLVAVAPVALVLGPLVLGFAAVGGGAHLAGAAEVRIGRLLILMFIPQIFCYGVVGTATAVMNSRQRFALAAGAPSIENLGTIAVLLATGVLYGTDTNLNQVPTGEMLLLGLGSTGAVVLHAATQWYGAKRAGSVLIPRPGWRDPEVRVVVRRAVPSLAQAGLLALQVLTLLTVANRLPGGVVGFQIALNFYYLAIAVGATPVALSLLPRLARMHLDGDTAGFRDTLVRGFALGLFVAIPAAVAYLVLAEPLARAISFGRMNTASGVTMVALSLAALSLAVVSQTTFMIATYASYARKNTRSPLVSMLLQAVICLGLAGAALLVHGLHVILALGLAFSVAVTVAACHLTIRLWRKVSSSGTERLAPSLGKFLAGALIMAGPAWLTATTIQRWLPPHIGARLGVVAAALVGGGIYIAVQAAWRTPELGWLAGGLGHVRNKARGRVAEVAVVAVVADGSAVRRGSPAAGAPADAPNLT
jgi:putative peptidoglycan lipid II flippase